jgi:hypothetical protein
MALGPGIPQPPPSLLVPRQEHWHRMLEHLRVVTRPILGRLYHEYDLEKTAVWRCHESFCGPQLDALEVFRQGEHIHHGFFTAIVGAHGELNFAVYGALLQFG